MHRSHCIHRICRYYLCIAKHCNSSKRSKITVIEVYWWKTVLSNRLFIMWCTMLRHSSYRRCRFNFSAYLYHTYFWIILILTLKIMALKIRSGNWTGEIRTFVCWFGINRQNSCNINILLYFRHRHQYTL